MSSLLNIVRGLRSRPLGGVVLGISSDGGSIAVAQEICSELFALKQAHSCPMIGFIGDTALSSAFYVAVAADTLLAQPASTVGSIGAVIDHANVTDAARRLGVTFNSVKSAVHKSALSARELMSPESAGMLQAFVDDIHEQFVVWVRDCRGQRLKENHSWSDGRLLSGRRALQMGLVDGLGGFRDAIAVATASLPRKTPSLLYASTEASTPTKRLAIFDAGEAPLRTLLKL